MTEPLDDAWSDPAPGRPIALFSAAAADVDAHISAERRGGSAAARFGRSAFVVVFSSSFHATFLYRIAHTCRGRLGLPGRVVAAVLFWWLRHFYGCAIASTARIFGGLILPHPQGIVVGEGVVVGPRAWIYQNVTLGGAPGKSGYPYVGADARIFAGAVLTGPLVLGDNVVVGANAVVSRDVPSRTAVRVAPTVLAPLADRFLVAGRAEGSTDA
jgi:serine O-acetyltransferase